jgi:two-component system, NtrC family, response regulator HydG
MSAFSTAAARPGGTTVRSIRHFGRVRAQSAAMHEVFDVLERLSATEVTITLVGDTGSGKDVLAQGIHAHSRRSEGPFVIFDCGAVAQNLAESELFGHERGSFTGAVNSHAGAFERAHGGTLFLDEVGEMPLDLQPRLLRALEGRRVRRVGGSTDRPVDVRVIAATNRDLHDEVAGGRFRQDLFFRLGGAVVRVPALRDRQDDLSLLVRGILDELGHAHLQVTDPALETLANHRWPGNVRELKNVLSSATAFVDGGILEPRHLRFLKGDRRESTLERLPLGGRCLEQIERAAIKQTLLKMGGNKTQAARALGIAVSTLYEKLKKYDL